MSTFRLQWVHGEILARMNEARLAVEAHAAEPHNRDSITRCCELVRQIHHVLIVVGVRGPALLVEEMRALAQEMAQDAGGGSANAHEALMRSLIDLAGYLDRLRGGWREHPLDVLQMVNDLRSARGQSLLSPGVLFSPPLWTELPPEASRPQRHRRDLSTSVHRLRRLYQIALLALLKGPEQREYQNLQRIDDILERVEVLTANSAALRLWWVARAMVQSLSHADLELTVACKRMLGQLDFALKALQDEGKAQLQRHPPPDLLRQLLYYAASSPAESGRTAEVKDLFGLRELMLSFNGNSTVGGHRAALSAVSAPLNSALSETEEKLSAARSPGEDEQWNQDLAAHVKQLAVTLGLLGIDELRTRLESRANAVSGAMELEPSPRSQLFLKLAEDLIDARAIIGALNDPSCKGMPSAAEIAVLRFREARLQGVAQIKNELFVVKEQFTDFVSNPAGTDRLVTAAGALQRCLGVLKLISPRAASEEIGRWVSGIRAKQPDELAGMGRADLEAVAGLIIDMETRLDEVDGSETPEEVTATLSTAQSKSAVSPSDGDPDVSATPRSDAQSNPLGFDQEMDDELRGIFTDEVAEVIETLNDNVPVWQADLSHRDALLEIRRAFHTLKGSGRVVGAVEVGDFAWSIESVLNRVIDGMMPPSSDILGLVQEGTKLLPQVLEALRGQQAVPVRMCDVQAQAERLVA